MEKVNQEKRMEILKAAVDLFSERGFERTTVDEIAARANVGKGTIYLYFANKEQIFIAIIESGIQYIVNSMDEILSQSGDFHQRFQEMFRQHLQFAEDHRKFYQLFLKEGLNLKFIGDKESQARIMKLHQKIHQQLTQLIQIGIDQNQIRIGDPSIFAFALSGIMSHSCFQWLTEKENGSLLEQMPVIIDLYLNGVGKKQ